MTLLPTTARTRDYYLTLRNRYSPGRVQIIFILESPPASGKYFYNPEGSVNEPLFKAMMKDVLAYSPTSKEDGLTEFRRRGFLIIDATHTPVNALEDKERDTIILRDFRELLADLRAHTTPETKIVLVKANVCEHLERKLQDAGFNVLNRGVRVPFPSTGQQSNFRERVRQALGLGKTS